MDSTALGMLAAEQRRRAEPLHLVAREPQLLRILEVTGYVQVVRDPRFARGRAARDGQATGAEGTARLTGPNGTAAVNS